MEQRQTAPAQDTERAVVDLETFERVWRRVMPNQDMSPIQVGAPTGPGTGAERQAERIPAPAQLQNQDQGAAPAAQIQSSAQLQPQSQVPAPAEQAAGQVRQLEELMEGAWMGHRIYLELARRGPDPERPGGGAAQDGPAAGGLLVPAHRRLLPLLQPAHPAGLPPGRSAAGTVPAGAEVETVMPAGGSGRGQHRLRGAV